MSSPLDVQQKFDRLKHVIKSYGRVGVAFSGGVDSTLLLLAATEIIDSEDIFALHGRSLLNANESVAEEFFINCFDNRANLEIIDLNPLKIPEFVSNDSMRCFHCKRNTYLIFKNYLKERGISVLLDGTNMDDTYEDRAGLRVIEELDIKTPLADVGLGKKDIRYLARSFNLPNYNMPSNSCLATRLIFLPEIEKKSLEIVAEIELELKKMGFANSRVRPDGTRIILELQEKDYLDIARKHNRMGVIRLCRLHGFDKVLLDIQGRN